MNTRERIIKAIKKFNVQNNNQVNLASEAAVLELAELVHGAVLKQSPETYNEQQLYLFTNNATDEHK